MGHSTCQGASVFGSGPTHRQRRTCDRCDRCPGCDPSVGRLKSDGEGGYYCTQCVGELKSQPAQLTDPTAPWGEPSPPSTGAKAPRTAGDESFGYGGVA